MSYADSSTALQSRRLTSALAGHAIGCEIQVHEELASTSDHVRELGQAGYPHGLVVFAEAQTAGRGRRDNRWTSEPGQDLLLSILLRPGVCMERWPRLTTIAALAICRAIENTTPLKPVIKWPNDIYLSDRKCAGILAESFTGTSGTFMVLGVGLNVNTRIFPPELPATSLRRETSQEKIQDRNVLAIALLKQLNQLVMSWDEGFATIIEEVRQRSWLLGKPITARMEGRPVEGIVVDLNQEGHLLVRQSDGTILTLSSAEQVRV
jgi:BirA family biotin operon repressor/biotin-[acetyl-CoA-carboxylase] ligase